LRTFAALALAKAFAPAPSRQHVSYKLQITGDEKAHDCHRTGLDQSPPQSEQGRGDYAPRAASAPFQTAPFPKNIQPSKPKGSPEKAAF